jgi:hypothetical protein
MRLTPFCAFFAPAVRLSALSVGVSRHPSYFLVFLDFFSVFSQLCPDLRSLYVAIYFGSQFVKLRGELLDVDVGDFLSFFDYYRQLIRNVLVSVGASK